MYKTQGRRFFKKASRKASFSTKFHYLARHLPLHWNAAFDFDAFRRVYEKSDHLPLGVERRYAVRLYAPDHLLHLQPVHKDSLGCSRNPNECPSWIQLGLLTQSIASSDAIMTPDCETFLNVFGRDLKFCQRCVQILLDRSRCQLSELPQVSIRCILLQSLSSC